MKTIYLLITILSLASISYVQGQVKPKPRTPSPPITTQVATTDDGRKVILKSNGTWKYDGAAEETPVKMPLATKPVSKKNGVLSLEAGLVFKSGDIKPVARTEFHLLDKSLAEILREAGVQGDRGDNSEHNLVFTYGLAMTYGQSNLPSGVSEAVRSHIVQSATSDFSGKAKFGAAPQGTYYVYALASTPKGFVIWNLKVDINSAEVSVTLDQNNADTAI